MDQTQLRYALAGVVLLMLGAIALRSRALRSAGVAVNQLGAKDNVSQRILVAAAPILVVYLLARAPFPQIDAFVRALPSPAPIAAFAIVAFAALFIIAAQTGMGKSWRVGVPDRQADIDTLVTGGLNRISRNPIYLGIMILLIGTGLAAPGPLTFAALVLAFVLLAFVIRKEERYLRTRFGAEFDAYARRVRRWI